MASQQPHPNPKPFSVDSLLSPPDMAKPYDSFRSPAAVPNAAITLTPLSSFHPEPYPPHSLPTPRTSLVNRIRDADTETSTLPPSPPVSLSEQKENIDDSRDPQLYSQEDSAANQDFPLFPDEQQNEYAQRTIAEHIRKAAPTAHPKPADYMVVVGCVLENYRKDPAGWIARERKILKEYGPRRKKAAPNPETTSTKTKQMRALAPKPNQGVVKKHKVAIPRLPKVSRPQRIPRPQRAGVWTPQSQVSDSFELYEAPAAAPKAKAPTSRDDVDYLALPDYAPPKETLPANNQKALNVEWKVGTLDLSLDPDRRQLAEAEVYCASRLRLSCATYLCSKRRIFEARVRCLKMGKEFRKTDAQQACKIDVNKASKLWTAFEKVGWFERRWFEQYLR